MKKVFLGGTCNNSSWRDNLIPLLKVDYFNPVVVDWTPECMQNELEEREKCDFLLYVITPLMTGVYSIAEIIDDSNKRPEKTILFISLRDINEIGEVVKFSDGQIRSLEQVEKMAEKNGAKILNTLTDVANYLNHQSGNEL